MGTPRPAVAQDRKGKDKAASTAAATLRPADPQAQTATDKKKSTSCSECGGYHQGECRKTECQRCHMHHWPQQVCTKRVEEVLAERIRHVRSVGDAAALQQVVNQMANDNSKRKKRKK